MGKYTQVSVAADIPLTAPGLGPRHAGVVVLVDASPTGWKEHGRFTIPQHSSLRKSGGRIWTHPVLAHGRLYLRDQEYLFCYKVK